MADLQEPEPTLNIDRHLRYWRMCLTAPLPHHYLSNEGNRMALAYFIINSIAILEPSLSPSCSSPDETSKPQRKPLLTPDLRKQLRKWILAHQHPGGGFIATSSLIFPFEEPDNPDVYQSSPGESSDYDPAADYPSPANLPATVFALLLLALLADENDPDGALVGVDRVKTLRWLRRLQREDGSFGEVVRRMPIPGEEMYIGGGYDMRYCYIASAIRWILRGDVKEGDDGWVEDIDIDGLRSYILRTQTYDGGFAGSSQEEPHAGYAFCAIAALSLLDRPLTNSTTPHAIPSLHHGIRDLPNLLHWLSSRQFVYLDSPDDDSSSDSDEDNFLLPPSPSSFLPPNPLPYVALNGRANKLPDTCYTWWVGAALRILGHFDLLDAARARRFLLERTAHTIGGFSKYPGGPPDVYHGCFGLAALGLLSEEWRARDGLAEVDAALAVPVGTVRVLERARGRLLRGVGR